MNTLTDTAPAPAPMGWFARSEAWLDSKGKGAWITAMILGFIFFWPVGLALVLYITFTNRWSSTMFAKSCRHKKSWSRHGMHAMSTTGNSAFDAYKADTLQRLEQEQRDFESFLERLREAKDKSEFDQFMDERARTAGASDEDDK
ncbi:MAG: DUF2852 domain-containing protein [Rhodobacteraceae bacterium]|nr:DUF2852 domain-containing protein [Paracoccaceae bacterium]